MAASRARRTSPRKIDAACRAWKAADPRRRLRQLADAVGRDDRTLWNWRHGKTPMDADEFLSLAWALGVSLDDLTE